MRTRRNAVFQGAFAMFEQRATIRRHIKPRIAVLFLVRQRRRMQEWHFLAQDRFIAGRLDVADGGVHEPHEIVGTARTHAPVIGRMPPMENVAFLELPRGARQNMRASSGRV